MSAYKELQEKAKALGIPYVGVSAEELEKAIQSKETQTPTETSPQPPAKVNTAIVWDNNREVRRYTLSEHGQDFAQLAKTFAAKYEYRVELKEVPPARRCPHCGGELN